MNRASNPLQIELGPSRLLGGYLVAAYAAALGIVVSRGLPGIAIGMAVMILLISGWRDFAKSSRSVAKQRIRRLVLFAQDDWLMVNGAGMTIRGRPLDAPLVHPWAVAFTLADKDGRKTPVLVLPDMTGPQNFHALRLWLRQNSQAVINGSPA